jgi:Mitochondrial ATP synthase B chain precursor (ATP-synt_B)
LFDACSTFSIQAPLVYSQYSTYKRVYRELPVTSFQQVGFHASSRREETVKEVVSKPEESGSSWDPSYGIPLGIAFAVPAINYEWYIVNEETQLAACMIAFTMLVYKNFGGVIHSALEEDGKRILEEHNRVEDIIINALEEKRDDIIMQKDVVQDAKEILALKIETYERLNEVGKIKPQHELKAQIERALALIAVEESSMIEKSKAALMVEATAAVRQKLLTDKKLQKLSLDSAIAQLTGKAGGADVVKETYLDFFKTKKAAKHDEVAEQKVARENIVTRLNAIAGTEGFFFRFDADGKPKMIV